MTSTKVARPVTPRTLSYAFHFFLAAFLGPYLVGVVFSFFELGAMAEIRPFRTLIVFPFSMLLLGFPVVLVFAILTFFPLQGVLQIKNPVKQRNAFLWVGGLLGVLVGLGLTWSGVKLEVKIAITAVSLLISIGCGWLDWRVWYRKD